MNIDQPFSHASRENEYKISNMARMRSAQYASEGNYSEALKTLHEAVILLPNDAKLLNNLGQLYAIMTKFDLAYSSLLQAVAIDPHIDVAWITLIKVSLNQKRVHETLRLLEQAALNNVSNDLLLPYRIAWLNRTGMFSFALQLAQSAPEFLFESDFFIVEYLAALSQVDKPHEAIIMANNYLLENPSSIDVLIELSLLLQQVNHPRDALSILQRIRQADHRQILNIAQAKVTILEDCGHIAEAIETASYCFNNSHDLARNAQLLFSLYASVKDWNSAWSYNKYRWLAYSSADPADPTILPRWEWHVTGACVYIYSEQGLGDQIFAYKLLYLYIATFPTDNIFCIEVNSKLVNVLPSCSQLLVLAAQGRALPQDTNYSHHISMYDLIETILTTTCHNKLFGNPEYHALLATTVKEYLVGHEHTASASALKDYVGISWRSNNPQVGSIQSIPLEHLLDTLQASGLKNLFSLQYLPTTEEQHLLATHPLNVFVPYSDLYSDLPATASFVQSVSHVLTVSTVTAHLAGLLGVPASLYLSPGRGKVWYWNLTSDSTSLIYPSLTLFEKKNRSDPFAPLIISSVEHLSAF